MKIVQRYTFYFKNEICVSLRRNITSNMKRLLLPLMVLLLCSNVLYSQNVETLPLDEETSLSAKDGWFGNTNLTMFTRLENAEYVIRPRQVNSEVGGQITKVKFYHHPYEEYNTTSYTIKIYEGGELQWYDQDRHLYELSSSGQQVYNQDYTASGDGWQTVELNTPYTIPDGEFWVGVQMHGMGTVAFGGENSAVENQYLFTEMYNYNWYWSPTYFFDNNAWQDVLYSLGLAVYTQGASCIHEAGATFAVYPNPAADQAYIQAEGLENITVFDLSGRIVREMEVSGNETTLDLNGLHNGLYFLKVTTRNGSSVKRLNVVR